MQSGGASPNESGRSRHAKKDQHWKKRSVHSRRIAAQNDRRLCRCKKQCAGQCPSSAFLVVRCHVRSTAVAVYKPADTVIVICGQPSFPSFLTVDRHKSGSLPKADAVWFAGVATVFAIAMVDAVSTNALLFTLLECKVVPGSVQGNYFIV